jgi:hypothetical protein
MSAKRVCSIGAAIFVLMGILSCGGGDSPVAPKDTTPPTVVSTAPANAATDVALNTPISVTFSEAIDPASVSSTTFSMSPSMTCSHNCASATATMTPSTALAYGTTYTVTATTGIKDQAGNALAAAHSWSFTTVAQTRVVANAGPDQDARTGVLVALDGSGSSGPAGVLTYTWTQLAGVDVTGGTNALHGVNPSFVSPTSVTTVAFGLQVISDAGGAPSPVDTMRVFVLVNPTAAFWVSAAGNDMNSGTRAEPFATITKGIQRAQAFGGADVYVARGDYAEAISLQSGVGLYGGYSRSWLRDVTANATTITTPNASGLQGVSVHDVVLDGFCIVSQDATASGGSSYGVVLRDCVRAELRDNSITAKNGVAGSAGPGGSPGGQGTIGSGGGDGHCDGGAGGGGGGGAAGQPGAYAGGDGGAGGAEDWWGAHNGHDGSAGGCPSGPTCSAGGGGGHGDSNGDDGSDGTAGIAGLPGQHGAAGLAFGNLPATDYVAAPGAEGAPATGGWGGGGGGGGGSQYCPTCNSGGGNGGGGGGGGGGYGYGGRPGSGGGGSFGVLILDSPGPVTLTRNDITTGRGGDGGAGGQGGQGGAGGTGGVGATACLGEIGGGGAGGNGGAGGAGGAGGGGGGGPSIGILQVRSQQVVTTNSSFSVGLAGQGGAAGDTPNNPGAVPGQNGEQANIKVVP